MARTTDNSDTPGFTFSKPKVYKKQRDSGFAKSPGSGNRWASPPQNTPKQLSLPRLNKIPLFRRTTAPRAELTPQKVYFQLLEQTPAHQKQKTDKRRAAADPCAGLRQIAHPKRGNMGF
ncbi:hypothetical protein [Acanthopleuribacter pedis]|uniref:Uncharacterized protein n=1 Tax=Acanthopleuribacter pedis TaxID=442870 RepID=A0A8J7Q761_9BACT|nr:hypothetical protein [Acanthopleuribacter pedis]MBO1319077.1 hypothetical protein [Acanthopleuribacter pedis]